MFIFVFVFVPGEGKFLVFCFVCVLVVVLVLSVCLSFFFFLDAPYNARVGSIVLAQPHGPKRILYFEDVSRTLSCSLT